jgi:hypothetical protein
MVDGVRQAKEGCSLTNGQTVQDLNRDLARQINEEALRNPQSPYAGKFVGIANGQVVVVADTRDEMSRRLRQIEPDLGKCHTVEASRDYSEVIEIWGLA